MAVKWNLTVDCARPGRLAEFWALALGYVPAPPPDNAASWEDWLRKRGVPEAEWDDVAMLSDPDGTGTAVAFLRVPEPKVVKNRMHLDVAVGGGRDETPHDVRWARIMAAVDRLTAAGGTVIAEVGEAGQPDHVTMADPEGNEFDVL